MPNSIKYNTSTETEALNSGDFWVGVGDVDKGPTQTTGYYNGINPPTGGYTIYVNKASDGPSIKVASDDAELISITNKIAGTSYTTINECFNYFDGQSDKMVTHQMLDFRITDGLVLDLDAGAIPSYPQNGTAWNDLSGNGYNNTLTNGPTFNSIGSITFDGVDDYSNATLTGANFDSTGFTLETWIKLLNEPGAWRSTFNIKNASNNKHIDIRNANGYGTMTINYYPEASDTNAGSVNIPENEWFHLVGVWDTEQLKLYVNGHQSGSIATMTSLDLGTSPIFQVGRAYDNSRYINDEFSMIKVYDRGLSPSEVLQNYYQAPIITDGLVFAADASNLVSYESGSTTTYSLTGSDTGTLTNGVAFDSGNGGTWDFDGADDYITLPSSIATALNGGTEASVCIWIKLNNQSNSVGDTGIIQLSNYNSSNGTLYFYSNGYTYLDIFRTDRVSQVFANNSVTATDWHMLTITTTPGTNGWKCYINTTLKKEITGQSTVSVNSTIQGGLTLGRNNTSRYTYGNIASCLIYDTALTADEVTQNYNATKSKFL